MPAPVRLGFLAVVVLGTGAAAQIGTDIVERRRADFHNQATDARHEARRRHAAARLGLRPAGRRDHAAGDLLRGRRHAALRQAVSAEGVQHARRAGRRSSSATASTRCRSASRNTPRASPNAGSSRWRSTTRATGSAAAAPTTCGCSKPDHDAPIRAAVTERARARPAQAHQPEQHPRGGRLPRRGLVPAGRAGVDPRADRHLGIEQRRHRGRRGRRGRRAREGGRVAGVGRAAVGARAGADRRRRCWTMRSGARGPGRAPKSTAASRSAARSTCGARSAIATCGPARRSIRFRRRRTSCFCRRRTTSSPGRGGAGAIAATKYLTERGVTAQTIVFPELTHFQAYSYTGFDVGSTLAADWFLKYLGDRVRRRRRRPPPTQVRR